MSKPSSPLPPPRVRLTGGLWQEQRETVARSALPGLLEFFLRTGRVEALKQLPPEQAQHRAHRMLLLEPLAEYADVMERALYNGVLVGMSRDGTRFTYANPLAVHPGSRDRERTTKGYRREEGFACSCCPQNLARLIASIDRYVTTVNDETIFVHLYGESEAMLTLDGQSVILRQATDYPWSGEVRFMIDSPVDSTFSLALRIPSWSRHTVFNLNDATVSPRVENGYACFQRSWSPDDRLTVTFDMSPQRVYAHPSVRANRGRVALQRGPLVYALESCDNGADIDGVVLPRTAELEERFVEDPQLGRIPIIETGGRRVETANAPPTAAYGTDPPSTRTASLRAIPYFLWNNRGDGELLVWMRETAG